METTNVRPETQKGYDTDVEPDVKKKMTGYSKPGSWKERVTCGYCGAQVEANEKNVTIYGYETHDGLIGITQMKMSCDECNWGFSLYEDQYPPLIVRNRIGYQQRKYEPCCTIL